MSDLDDDAVLVDHMDAPPELKDEDDSASRPKDHGKNVVRTNADDSNVVTEGNDDAPQAYQIVSIGTEEKDYAFRFHADEMNEIIGRIPAGLKVAVVSVVGAFRTGKSFLLSWFLRYLNHLSNSSRLKTDTPDSMPWYQSFQSLGNEGFDWKGGSERNTTGIWMWNEPFFIDIPGQHQPLAVLLVDTQGMFDHETSMSLTSSIFAFSTLLSSYQIYNVSNRIQEDNLQHCAMFAEYARVATNKKEEVDETVPQSEQKVGEKEDPKPFQHIDFLVRDWSHFGDDDEGDDGEDLDKMVESMEDYLKKVMADRDAKDLRDTREQIVTCFEKISCFGLSHPGLPITKKKYTGDLKAIEPTFLKLLDLFCHRVFNPETLEPKLIRGRQLTAVEFGTFAKTYAGLFEKGANFPEATTMLEATASANNTTAVQMAVLEYKGRMDRVAGPNCSNYIKPDELRLEHRGHLNESMRVFEGIANFGSKAKIDTSRKELLEQLTKNLDVYESLNEGRNPLAGLETYVLPGLVAIAAWVLEYAVNLTCAPYYSVCQAGSEFFWHSKWVVLCFIGIIVATKYKQVKDLFNAMAAAGQGVKAKQD